MITQGSVRIHMPRSALLGPATPPGFRGKLYYAGDASFDVVSNPCIVTINECKFEPNNDAENWLIWLADWLKIRAGKLVVGIDFEWKCVIGDPVIVSQNTEECEPGCFKNRLKFDVTVELWVHFRFLIPGVKSSWMIKKSKHVDVGYGDEATIFYESECCCPPQ